MGVTQLESLDQVEELSLTFDEAPVYYAARFI